MSVFKTLNSTCSSVNGDSIADCFGQKSNLQIFNWTLNQQNAANNANACGSQDATMSWMRSVEEDFINCCGANKMDFNFFKNSFGGSRKSGEIPLNHYIRYRGFEDENVVADNDGFNVTGYTASFTLNRNSHSKNGQSDVLAKDEMLYNYRSKQFLKIGTKVTTTDFSHIIPVTNTRTAAVDIKKGDKMIKVPAVLVSGYSCKVGQATLNTGFSTKAVNNIRMRKSWCMKLEMDRAYADKLMFATFFDKNGKAHDAALPTIKMRAMQEITQAMNLFLFFGNTVTNTSAITVDAFTGGEGMMTSLENAGNIWDYDYSKGVSLTNDFTEIILNEEAKKRTTEWMVKGSLRFFNSLVTGTKADFKSEVTPLDFGTLKRFGAGDENIVKLGVQSYTYLGRKIAFHEWGELSTTNGIGNGDLPDTGIMMAMDGLTNSGGAAVPPIQFFNLKGYSEFQDIDVDMRYSSENRCEELQGDVIATESWVLNCPDRHWLIKPQYC